MPRDVKVVRHPTEPINTGILDTSALLAEDAELQGRILRKLYGQRGGSITAILYGSEFFRQISKNGWEGEFRKKRLSKHQRSIVKARAVLKEIRAAKKRYGNDWIMRRFREKLQATGDAKSALHKILGGN
jgi:hypothetical protein